MIVSDVVKEEAARFDREVADDEIEAIVWTFTGYPCFWPDDSKTPEENFRTQLHEYFKDPKGTAERQRKEEEEFLKEYRKKPA